MNVRLEYLYRDAGNFKKWGDVVFANPDNTEIEKVTRFVEAIAIESLYFEATKVGLPDLHFDDYLLNLDHTWHEIHLFSITKDSPSDDRKRSIDEFMVDLNRSITNQ